MRRAKHIIEAYFDPNEGEPFKARLGRCYELAGRFASHNEHAVLIHGSIQGFGRPRIKHAWVEIDGGVWEPASGQLHDPDVFRAVFNPQEEKRYDHEQTLVASLREKHWGPWDGPPPRPRRS